MLGEKMPNPNRQQPELETEKRPGVSVETDAKSGKTLVNKKPGGQVKNGNAASMGLTCYAADANKNEQFCATSY